MWHARPELLEKKPENQVSRTTIKPQTGSRGKTEGISRTESFLKEGPRIKS